MTTSPRFFAATLTVLAETRFVDVRACIIFAFRKFRVRVYADAFVVLATPTMPRRFGSGSNRPIVNRRFDPEERNRVASLDSHLSRSGSGVGKQCGIIRISHTDVSL